MSTSFLSMLLSQNLWIVHQAACRLTSLCLCAVHPPSAHPPDPCRLRWLCQHHPQCSRCFLPDPCGYDAVQRRAAEPEERQADQGAVAAHLPGDGNLLPLSVLLSGEHAGSGLDFGNPIQRLLSLQHCYCHCTELATFMLSGSIRDPAPCYVDSQTNTAHRQYNQLRYPWPRPQRRRQVNLLLSSVLDRLLTLVLSWFMFV